MTIRLVGGADDREGRVEVYAVGLWGTVCDDNWDIADIAVVCRQLGFTEAGMCEHSVCRHNSTVNFLYHPIAVEVYGEARFGEGTGPIWLDEDTCSGMETQLLNCASNALGMGDCLHDEDAGVRCEGKRLLYTLL